MSGCPVWAAAPSKAITYQSGTTIRASDVNLNESTIYNYLQAGVDTYSDGSIVNADISGSASIAYSKLSLNNSIVNADISSSAAIAYSKLNLATSILNADVSASAAIVDTKLATISTAGKVSGAALTSLSSTPSGAGVIPTANLGSGATATTFLRGDQTYAIPGNYILSSTTTVSAATTSSSITIATNKVYKLFITLEAAASAETTVLFTINGDISGTDYQYVNTKVTIEASPAETHTGSAGAATGILLGAIRQDNGFIIGEYLLNTYQNQTSTTSYNVQLVGSSIQFNQVGTESRVDTTGLYAPSAPTSFTINADQNFDATISLYEIVP